MPGPASTAADPASVARFVEKWAGAELWFVVQAFQPACHAGRLKSLHHNEVVGHPTPATADPTGADYTFEKRVKVVGVASNGGVSRPKQRRESRGGCRT